MTLMRSDLPKKSQITYAGTPDFLVASYSFVSRFRSIVFRSIVAWLLRHRPVHFFRRVGAERVANVVVMGGTLAARVAARASLAGVYPSDGLQHTHVEARQAPFFLGHICGPPRPCARRRGKRDCQCENCSHDCTQTRAC